MSLPDLHPDRIPAAAERIRGYLQPTPTVESPALSDLLDATVYVKCEFTSPIASFKARGALFALLEAGASGPSAVGAVTSSTGNHGQGVAWAARRLGISAHVFLPRDPNPVKRAMIERLGATVVVGGDDIDDAKAAARAFAAAHHLVFVDDGDSEDVIYGAGTVGLELRDQVPHLDYCFVPMGGGSLATGIAAAMRLKPDPPRVVAVQSAEAPAMVDSFHARAAVDRPIRTLAEGLACRVPAHLALSGLITYVDDAITVPDSELLRSMGIVMRDAHYLVEPAAAASLAGAMAMRERLAGKRVALILTGANATADMIRRALAAAEVG
jgi:threonine dehydratase